jgi:hypothetical protein
MNIVTFGYPQFPLDLSGISGANRFNPFNIAPHSRQVLIAIFGDNDNIFDSDPTDWFVFL